MPAPFLLRLKVRSDRNNPADLRFRMPSQTALITGASAGIGYDLAKLFAQDHSPTRSRGGMRCLLTYRRGRIGWRDWSWKLALPSNVTSCDVKSLDAKPNWAALFQQPTVSNAGDAKIEDYRF
jgi:NAD(P)-dependent dehydrogenase (short-subunit alcohol dehydrogenase family)